MNGRTIGLAPYHEGEGSCSKFGQIPPSGLGDSVMDGQQTHGRADTRKNNVALAHPYYEGMPCSKFG